MKIKHLAIALVVLFLVFVGIWIISPKVGEKINPNEGVDVEFENKDYDLPKELPEGFVRYTAITDAVVYRFENENKTFTYYEYVGDEKFTYYDINKPSFFVRSSFDKSIYQIKDKDGTLREEYRAYNGKKWQVVSKDRKTLLSIPDNYIIMPTYINLYVIDNETSYSYKLLTKLGDKYAWLSPSDASEWINTTIPETFSKTEVLNVYKTTTETETIYKKVLLFNDPQKTVVVVACDKDGKYI